MENYELMEIGEGTEMNALVAIKVMRWKLVEGIHTGRMYWEDENGMLHGEECDFEPSKNISAAWEVVEIMRTVYKQCITIIDNPHLNYDVRFSGSNTTEYVRLSNLPLAICRSALIALSEQSE